MPGRYALIVATDAYEDPKLRKLRAPARDAEALAGVLRDPAIGDFEVDLVTNPPDAVLRRRIAAFFGDRRRDDVLLLHFSCHGLKDDSGQLYFAARDTEVDQLDASAVSAEFVSRQMARSRSSSVLMLLDCCYSGAIARGLTFRAGDSVDVNDHLGGHGRAIMTASSAMEYAFEGDDLSGEGRPSVFTSAVVKALETGEADRDQDHWISVRELYDYVSDEVRELTPHQRPNLLSHLEGELYIARSRYEAPAGARAAARAGGDVPSPAPAAVLAPRIALWPIIAAVLGGAAILLGWFLPWQYNSSAKDLLSAAGDVSGDRVLLLGLLVPAVLAPVVAVRIPSAAQSRWAGLACRALAVLAGLAVGIVLANIAYFAGGPFGAGPYIMVVGALAIVAAMTAALWDLPPSANRRHARIADAVAGATGLLAALLVSAGPLGNFGSASASSSTIEAGAVVIALAGAAGALARVIVRRIAERRATALLVAAAGAAVVGAAVPPNDPAAVLAALAMAAAALTAAA